MPYITREDGEHFVIPSYREVLTVKQKSQLKKDILLLSQSYGELITMQRKSALSYEVAFSPDTGYLLGESIWHQFKRPLDMIYCEAIPNTTEVILVIVKDGSVYLDGSFPADSIPEELVIFLTQQNNFEIYVYGDVPISQTPETGKFSFEPAAVKSFTVLDKPIFPTLPLLKIYQLQPVELVLKQNAIGIFPTKQILTAIAVVFGAWLIISYLSSTKITQVQQQEELNPYQAYLNSLSTPAPDEELKKVLSTIQTIYTAPGWSVASVKYSQANLVATVKSNGGKVTDLFTWAKLNNFGVDIKPDGIYLTKGLILTKRPPPTKIFPLKETMGVFIDKLSLVYPGNRIKLGDFRNRGKFMDVNFSILLSGINTVGIGLISDQLTNFPFVLQNVSVDADKKSNFSGQISIQAVGS